LDAGAWKRGKGLESFYGCSRRQLPADGDNQCVPLTRISKVRFYVLTFAGALTSEVDGAVLNRGKHALSRLFFYGQEVITQIRLQQEQKKN